MANDQETASTGTGGAGWERDVLHRLAFAGLEEQRRTRRWNLLFRFLLLAYLFVVLYLFIAPTTERPTDRRHTAVIDVSGVIADFAQTNAANVNEGLRAAFANEQAAGILLRINTPGGSPVQAGYIFDEIMRLRAQRPDLPVYAVVEDVGASGGYYIAAAADEIYANRASIVGSIGVLMSGFGFVDTLERLGIERRLVTAGENKGFMDPFSPVAPGEREHLDNMLQSIHRQFIDAVKSGRGDRLNDDPVIFSGLVWTGEESVALGLVDGLASPRQVAVEKIGVERMVNYTPQPGLLEQLTQRLGTSMGQAMAAMFAGPPLR